MTSKEALDWLVNYLAPFHFHANKEKADKINNVLLTLKQDLERLETLEKENKKWREIVGCDLCEALGREILLEENEKLKKAIEKELALLKERRETFWFTDSYDEYAVVNEIIEEFEEVLGDAT